MLYNDGLAAIISFGGIYAAATFGWSTVTIGIFGIIVTVFAIPGAFLGGRLDDRLGSKRTVQLALLGVVTANLGIVSIGATSVLFVLPAPELVATRGLFGSLQEQVFMGFALLLGFCMGPMQAASRTMIARLAPPGMTGEFFGLFALSGRATAWMAPFAIGVITVMTQSNRLGVACVLVFLVLGFLLLLGVREERTPA
jgi:UMF1 family MFS transporter